VSFKKTGPPSDIGNGRADSATIADKFHIFPEWRMVNIFPWQIWAVGWLAIFKAVLWLATDPNMPEKLANILAAKFLVFMIPLIILGFSVWNLKKWGIWGLIILSAADLLVYIVIPEASGYIMGNNFWLIAAALLVCNGPVGDILILLASPVMLKHADRRDRFSQPE
jgi:hypothetical protein